MEPAPRQGVEAGRNVGFDDGAESCRISRIRNVLRGSDDFRLSRQIHGAASGEIANLMTHFPRFGFQNLRQSSACASGFPAPDIVRSVEPSSATNGSITRQTIISIL